MNTVLTNRLGDFMLFLYFSFIFFSCFLFLSLLSVKFVVLLILILASFTKSAQFPLGSWLPKAISAPTPIRALVHRRTLVTAGLVLLFNFSLYLFRGEMLMILFIIGLFTSLFSSLSGIFEEDLKKVVALSTLSQIGFSFLGLGLGLYFLSFIHLISHALFKSTLFLQVGFIMHNSFRQQDGRNYRNLGFFVYFFQVQLLVTLLCLCGLLFSSGYVTKEILIFFLFKFNFYIFIFFFFYLIIFLTFIYRFRL